MLNKEESFADYWKNEIGNMEAPHAGMPCPNIGTAKGQPIKPSVTLAMTQKLKDIYEV